MVTTRQIHASNALLSSPSPSQTGTQTNSNGLTFVFAGATAGIGLSTLKALARRTVGRETTAYIIGRSRARFQPHLDELEKLNPHGRWVFLEGQFTLLKEGKRLADEIIRMEGEGEGGGKVDALVMSTGFLTFNGEREDTEEGIDADTALQYYNRFLLTTLLLPLLSKAPSGRVVTVFSAGNESNFTKEALTSEFKTNFSRIGVMMAVASLLTLSLEQLANRYPNISFIHSYPGGVQTDLLDKLLDTAKGVWIYPASFVKRFLTPVIWLISKPFQVPVEETGERHLFLATSAAYPAAEAKEGAEGVVPLGEGVERKRCSVENEGKGNGVYRTTKDCESLGENKALTRLRKEGLDVLGWRETVKVFERVLGEGVVRGV